MKKRQSGTTPEYNLIQEPELLKRLGDGLGLRQAHITPALNEGLQAVVIAADFSKTATAPFPATYWGGIANGKAAPARGPMIGLWNKSGSGVIARLRAVSHVVNASVIALATVNANYYPDATAAAWQSLLGSDLGGDNVWQQDPPFLRVAPRVQPILGSDAGESTVARVASTICKDNDVVNFAIGPNGFVLRPNTAVFWRSNEKTAIAFMSLNMVWDEEPEN